MLNFFTYHFILILVVLAFGVSQSVLAQTDEQPSNKKSTFQISFVPGLSTSGTHSTSKVSFNILGGYNGAYNGFELGSVFNGNRYDVSGLQISGGINFNQQQARGLLLAGAVNLSKTFAGGASFAGVANINKNHNRGLMAAGGINISRKTSGIALAPINITSNQSGTQIGVINTAKWQGGTQIGIINIVSKNNEGTPVGLLSFVKNGRYNVDAWGTETGFINGGMRFGTEEIYNILSIGYNPYYGNNLWQVGLGIGYHHSLNEQGDGLETDITAYQLNYDGKWTTKTSNHIQWRMHYVHGFTKGIRMFVGPSVNLLITDNELPTTHVPYSIFDHSSGSTELRWWIGGTLGIGFF